MTSLKNFSFIVSCHNGNLPVLEVFEKYAQNYLSLDNQIQKYLICEDYYQSKSYFNHIIKNTVGKSWSKQLLDSLKKIQTKYVIYCLEDYIFYKKVDIKLFNHYLNWAFINDVNYLRLMPKPKGFKKVDKNIYELGPYSLYKSSLFFTVWNREHLISLLELFNDPWEFEVLGTRHVKNIDKYYTINEKFIFIHHLVAKGSWINKSLKKLNLENNLIIQKPIMKPIKEFIWHLKKNLLSLFELIPDNHLKYNFYYLFKSKK